MNPCATSAVGLAGFIAAGLLAPVAARAAVVNFATNGAFGSAVWGGIDNTGCSDPPGYSVYDFVVSSQCVFGAGVGAAYGSTIDPVSGSSVSASASLATGSVSVTVAGQTFIPNIGSASSYGSALIWDTLRFSGAGTGTAVQLTMSGASSIVGDGQVRLLANLLAESPGYSGGVAYYLLGNTAGPPATVGPYSTTQTIMVADNTAYLLVLGVMAYGGVTGAVNPPYPPTGNVTVSDPFSLSVPQGVTVQSAYAQAAPEPGTLALFISAAGVVIGLRRAAAR